MLDSASQKAVSHYATMSEQGEPRQITKETILEKHTPSKLTIASRQSRLAMWQAEHVRSQILSLYPRCVVEILGMTTRGDQILDRPLSDVGGKGLFIKELEVAMAEGRADLAVHSLKDMPFELPSGFVLGAVLEREDPRDAFISNRYESFLKLPQGAIVGTSSLRRQSSIAEQHPHLVVRSLRGNVDTRLGKLDSGEYDAIILAAAGLKRLGWQSRIRTFIEPEQLIPAPGQGAMVIEFLADREDLREWCEPLNHLATQRAITAERTVAALLGGGCQVPLAAYASIEGTRMRLQAMVATSDGRLVIRGEASGPADAPEALGETVALALRQQGAADVLAACHAN
jgi:hydroxymethylbilane synthase